MPEYYDEARRAGDVDRERYITRLQQAFSTGHLSHEEFLDRQNQVFGTRYMNELERITRGLPAPPEPKSHLRLPDLSHLSTGQRALGWTGVFVANIMQFVMTVIYMVHQSDHHHGLSMGSSMVLGISIIVFASLFFLAGIRAMLLAVDM